MYYHSIGEELMFHLNGDVEHFAPPNVALIYYVQRPSTLILSIRANRIGP